MSLFSNDWFAKAKKQPLIYGWLLDDTQFYGDADSTTNFPSKMLQNDVNVQTGSNEDNDSKQTELGNDDSSVREISVPASLQGLEATPQPQPIKQEMVEYYRQLMPAETASMIDNFYKQLKDHKIQIQRDTMKGDFTMSGKRRFVQYPEYYVKRFNMDEGGYKAALTNQLYEQVVNNAFQDEYSGMLGGLYGNFSVSNWQQQ